MKNVRKAALQYALSLAKTDKESGAPEEENACTHCFGNGKLYVCNKMPDCRGGFYFKKLSNYEVRQVKKQGKNINKIES